MKKIVLIVLVICFPYNSFAVMRFDIYNQQSISGTYIFSGYNDIALNKNAKNMVMSMLYHQVVDYIFDNTHTTVSKNLSINMPANLQECDDEYKSNLEQEVSLKYSTDVLNICREDVYTKNLEYLLQEVATVENGAYYVILESMFKDKTKDILTLKKFTMDKFIDILASNRLISFNGKLFLDKNNGVDLENIKCENNHIPVSILNSFNNNTIMDNITINNRDFYIQGCLVKNKHSYFKYITIYEKKDTGYDMYMRIPLYKHLYDKDSIPQHSNVIFANIKGLHFNIYEPLGNDISLAYDYMVYRKGVYLQNFSIKYDNAYNYIYTDTTKNKFVYTENNISLSLFSEMIKNYCKQDFPICELINNK